ncbi:hypothetical protein [Jatrophihabitans sp.]|uniref:VG15 protein n=1 Tax=Jatrophihabitans sp. TaxID=1932789 RepID=UPI0030C6D85B|nr:hypothetical protein [Jatrophihabitans sp.]
MLAIRRLFERHRPLPEIVATVSAYQAASATTGSQAIAEAAGAPPVTIPKVFAGVSSHGFPVAEPIIATIDRYIPAPVEPLPDAWWGDALEFMADIEALIESEIQDAGRSASQVEIVNAPDWQNYVRVLVLPSCKRCTVLAGRIYRDLEAFKRHPQCDCQMWPVQDWEQAHDAGLISSPQEAFDKGAIRDLTIAETQAINDGADITKVINSSRGIYTADVFGHRVKATTESTTKRAAWRRANPTRLVRLRPEAIYRIARDHEDAIRLLRLYGYLTP